MKKNQSSMNPEGPIAGQEYTVISLRPAWAWAVMYGGKDIENRSWPTSRRGRVLIHASGHKASAQEDAANRDDICRISGLPRSALPLEFERSAILGSVEIADCVEDARSRWAGEGQFHWKLSAPKPFARPVRDVKGKLQFWRWTMGDSTPQRGSSPAPVINVSATEPKPESDKAREPDNAAFDLDNLAPETVLAALRKVGSSKPANETDVLRAAGRELGCTRLGSRVRRELKGHVRTAIKRGVLAREGETLRLATEALRDYETPDLVAAMAACARKGQVLTKSALAMAVARRLGFAEHVDANTLEHAFRAAITGGGFIAEGSGSLRRVA